MKVHFASKAIPGKVFWTALIGGALVQCFSLIGSASQSLENIFFVILIATLLGFTIVKIKWGIYAATAELVIGSFGQIVSFETEGFGLSLRIAIWIVILAVWIGREVMSSMRLGVRGYGSEVKKELQAFIAEPVHKWLALFIVVIMYAVFNGVASNSFELVYLDTNNWLFGLYIIPLYHAIKSVNDIYGMLNVVIASVILIIVQSILVFYIFSHSLPSSEVVYTWIRDARLGEITYVTRNFFRVFLQSQIWIMVNFFVMLSLIYVSDKIRFRGMVAIKKVVWILMVLSAMTLVISFSRSIWVGTAAGLCAFLVTLRFMFREKYKQIVLWAARIAGIFALGIFGVWMLMMIPPGDYLDNGLGSLIGQRLTQGEAASSARINQLQPLFETIHQRPIFGSGFGTTVTYKSDDPRVRAGTVEGTGMYTTYAFEWGYLDMIVKFGFFGLFVFIGFLITLAKEFYKTAKIHALTLDENYPGLSLGILLGLVALMTVHTFTPFLNHPLGIGFIVMSLMYRHLLHTKKLS